MLRVIQETACFQCFSGFTLHNTLLSIIHSPAHASQEHPISNIDCLKDLFLSSTMIFPSDPTTFSGRWPVKAQRYCLLTASGRFCGFVCLNAHNHFIDHHSCHKCSDMIVPHYFYIINTNSVGFFRMVGVLCFPKNLYY